MTAHLCIGSPCEICHPKEIDPIEAFKHGVESMKKMTEQKCSAGHGVCLRPDYWKPCQHGYTHKNWFLHAACGTLLKDPPAERVEGEITNNSYICHHNLSATICYLCKDIPGMSALRDEEAAQEMIENPRKSPCHCQGGWMCPDCIDKNDATIRTLQEENAQYQKSSAHRQDRFQKWVEKWREAHPGKELVRPDLADGLSFIMDCAMNAEARVKELEGDRKLDAASMAEAVDQIQFLEKHLAAFLSWLQEQVDYCPDCRGEDKDCFWCGKYQKLLPSLPDSIKGKVLVDKAVVEKASRKVL